MISECIQSFLFEFLLPEATKRSLSAVTFLSEVGASNESSVQAVDVVPAVSAIPQ